MNQEQRGEGGALVIVADPKLAKAAMDSFQSVKRELLDKADMQTIGGKTYIKRSGWRKISLAFHVSVSIVAVQKELLEPGEWLVEVKARAVNQAGTYSEEIGACQSSELTKNRMEPTLHNLETKAATRAINRAVSNLVGGGVVSADEMTAEPDEPGDAEAPKKEPLSNSTSKAEDAVGSNPTPDGLESKLLKLPWKQAQSGKLDYVDAENIAPELAGEIGMTFDPAKHEWSSEAHKYIVKDNGSLLRFKRKAK